jgi:hypothetical protein
MPPRRHLRAVGARQDARPGCRTRGCASAPTSTRGYCTACEAVYRAAVTLRDRLLERRGQQLQAARPALFEGMDPASRARLVAHVAAQSAHRGQHPSVLDLAGLEDFLEDLRDLHIDGLLT